jgi:protein-tyrosine phosphatase
MPQIMFVCTANRYRSVVAAACFRDELTRRNMENEWSISSAGTWAMNGLPAMADAIILARELGLDIQEHRSQVITAEMLHLADVVLVMESGQKEALQVEFPDERKKIFLLSEASKGISFDIPDPVSGPAIGIQVVPEICDLIRTGFDQICSLVRL